MDQDDVWRAPKAQVRADPRGAAWFGLGAMLWGSLFGGLLAGLWMMAMNYRAQGRRRLAWAVAAASLLAVAPGLCWIFIYVAMSVVSSAAGQIVALVVWLAAQPLATLTLLGSAHRHAMAERRRTGQPMRPAAHAALVVLAVWSLPLLFLVLTTLAAWVALFFMR